MPIGIIAPCPNDVSDDPGASALDISAEGRATWFAQQPIAQGVRARVVVRRHEAVGRRAELE